MTPTGAATGHWYGPVLVVSDRSFAVRRGRAAILAAVDRPNQLWVSDFTYVSTWQGWLYVAFVVDVFARRIVGWRASSSMTNDFVLDALEKALDARQPERDSSLVHHSDRGSAVRVDSPQRESGRSRCGTLGGQQRRQLRHSVQYSVRAPN